MGRQDITVIIGSQNSIQHFAEKLKSEPRNNSNRNFGPIPPYRLPSGPDYERLFTFMNGIFVRFANYCLLFLWRSTSAYDTHLRMLRQWTGKKQPANMMTTATSILAAFRRVLNCPIVLELAGGHEFRKSVNWNLFVIVVKPGLLLLLLIGFRVQIKF